MNRERDIRTVVDEMIDHIDYVFARTANLSASQFFEDRDVRQSVERSLEIVSEASRHLPDEVKQTRPEIKWRQVADFGNVLRHTYFSIDNSIVWQIIQKELRELREAVVLIRGVLR
jgi:uncharacterized protein with HEPN domain